MAARGTRALSLIRVGVGLRREHSRGFASSTEIEVSITSRG